MDVASKPTLLLKRVQGTGNDLIIAAVITILLLWFLPSWMRNVIFCTGSFIFFVNVIATFITNWRPRKKLGSFKKSVIISGCDSGFGYQLAQRLDAQGYQVFAGCLFPDGDGAQNLRKSSSSRLHVIQMDVTKDEDVQKAVTYVKSKIENNKLWAVVCNAGVNDGGEIEWTNMEIIKRVLDVNMLGTVRVAKAFLPEIRKNKGRVVAVASAAGRYTYMGCVPYCMSKCGIVSFCDGLRLEMYKWGVQVITVEPWIYKTKLTSAENVTSYIQNAWNKAPEEIRNSYPKNYLELFIKVALAFLNMSISDNPNEVVSCLEEAVTAENPKYSYDPGTLLSRLSFWFIRKLPKSLSDFVMIVLTTGDAANEFKY